jgi:hypothetical protein
VNHRLSDIAENLIHGVRKRVDNRRLLGTGENDGRTAMLLEIANQCGNPAGRDSRFPS